MSITPISADAGIAAAHGHRLEAGTWIDGDPVSQEDAARSALRQLARVSAGAGTADALLSCMAAAYVVPIDTATLEVAAEPFDSFTGILAHYNRRFGDGCGLLLGEQRDGGVIVALQGTQASYNEWLAATAVEKREREFDDGSISAELSYRAIPPSIRIHWAPPPVSVRATAVAIGNSAIFNEGERHRFDRAGVDEKGWVAWSVAPENRAAPRPGERLKFTSRRLPDGMELLADGVLPLAAVRSDGWTLTATGIPRPVDELPTWLIDAWGGKWVSI